MSHGSQRSLNRLANAKSPYLLQHATNPVDWYEWGTEAFEKAKSEDKPIFLSVGYSACHWCHVLAHESFEDKFIASIMNEHFVNIKVDREERPDVDRLYMLFLQASTGGGGWPMSVWLTPDLHPYVAATYLSKGQFRNALSKLVDMWEDDRERCIHNGRRGLQHLVANSEITPGSETLPLPKISRDVYERLDSSFDRLYGGFGGAPKFPSPSRTMHFLARYAIFNQANPEEAERAKHMAVNTMVNIYNGGIRDVVGGGFARYSVDERWHVPHFEKMLYDQAQLLTSALELSQMLPSDSSEKATLQAMATEIIAYVSRDLRDTEGGFYSAEDADSLPTEDDTDTKEGAFYVWTAKELDDILEKKSQLFKLYYGVREEGNCDPSHDIQGELKGQNVLYRARPDSHNSKEYRDRVQNILETSLAKLAEYRNKNRPRPDLDDKILTGWNGLMISGLAKASEILEAQTEDVLRLAEEAAAFIRENLYDESSGEVKRSYRQGPGPTGQADDYAFLIQGLLDLYEASGKEEYVVWAIRLQEKQDELFYDKEGSGYFAAAPDEHLLVRMKDAQDGAEPSAASVTLYNLHRLAHFAEDRHEDYHSKAQSILRSNSQLLTRAPFVSATMVSAAMAADKGYKQFIVTGAADAEETKELLRIIRGTFVPNRVLIHLDPSQPPRELARVNGTLRALVEGRGLAQTMPNVRLCENFTCGLPIYAAAELAAKVS